MFMAFHSSANRKAFPAAAATLILILQGLGVDMSFAR